MNDKCQKMLRFGNMPNLWFESSQQTYSVRFHRLHRIESNNVNDNNFMCMKIQKRASENLVAKRLVSGKLLGIL